MEAEQDLVHLLLRIAFSRLKSLDDVAQDGGFILSTGAVLDDAKPENLHALIDTGKQYGVYR